MAEARYRVLRSIGRGGMADVFEAVTVGHDGFRRRVAMKRLLPAYAHDDALLAMFLDEARIASHLNHPNVLSILDYGLLDDTPFQVLELVDGLDAARLFDHAKAAGLPMPVEVALHIAVEVAHALDHAHRARDDGGSPLGIVHRDVSAANVLVSWSGAVKLSDFGIAFARARTQRTEVGTTKGNLHFMAPEQFGGEPVDSRTDVFALGCVLHMLVAGYSPQGPAGIARMLNGDELLIDPALSADVAAIVARAVRRAPADRHPSADALSLELGAALARRITVDGRSLLKDWMARIAGEPPPPASSSGVGLDQARRPGADEGRGRLDDLVDLELVLDPGRSDRRFATRSLATPTPDHARSSAGALAELVEPAPPDAAPPAAAGPTSARTHERTARGRRRALWIVLGGLLLLIVGRWTTEEPDGARFVDGRPAPTSASSSMNAGTVATGARARDPAAGPTPAPSPASAPAPTPAAVDASIAAPATRDPLLPGPRSTAASPVVRRPVDDRAGTGFVAIGGAAVMAAAITIDGVPAGFAPKLVELPLGRHVIELAPDGGRATRRTIVVTPGHTRKAALRLIIADAP